MEEGLGRPAWPFGIVFGSFKPSGPHFASNRRPELAFQALWQARLLLAGLPKRPVRTSGALYVS